ncbi:MAG: hypothetical protein HYR66_10130 [Sphingobacteriales bacterium]|nr:hypothetical protein [Sphingobacteriales bacterium]MBI3717202.1 hypothetical protein [Sphingobacteriales bacterium]
MKIVILFSVATISLFFSASGQITKNNWMVGGNIGLAQTNYNSGVSVKYKLTTVSLSPNIGYFIWDKTSAGIKTSVLSYKTDFPNGSGGSTIRYSTKTYFYNIGPFARYYFLNEDKRTNIFIEGAYQYQFRKDISPNTSSNLSSNVFTLSAGPVIYFNSSVGIEFTLGYSTQKFKGAPGSNNTIQTNIGLQVHLEKEKK